MKKIFTWNEQVRYPQRRDSGVYECQVSTTPPVAYSMILSVVGKCGIKKFLCVTFKL